MSFIPATLWFHQTSSDVQWPCEVPMNLATTIHFQWVDQPLEIQHGLLDIYIYIETYMDDVSILPLVTSNIDLKTN